MSSVHYTIADPYYHRFRRNYDPLYADIAQAMAACNPACAPFQNTAPSTYTTCCKQHAANAPPKQAVLQSRGSILKAQKKTVDKLGKTTGKGKKKGSTDTTTTDTGTTDTGTTDTTTTDTGTTDTGTTTTTTTGGGSLQQSIQGLFNSVCCGGASAGMARAFASKKKSSSKSSKKSSSKSSKSSKSTDTSSTDTSGTDTSSTDTSGTDTGTADASGDTTSTDTSGGGGTTTTAPACSGGGGIPFICKDQGTFTAVLVVGIVIILFLALKGR